MLRTFLLFVCSLFASVAIAADQPAASATVAAAAATAPAAGNETKANAGTDTGPKALSGMSILGNQEAPKALVIVPWKSSQLGDALGISKNLDDGRQPVDKDVFMRQLSYYEIRANSK
jgi:hypothetical protein